MEKFNAKHIHMSEGYVLCDGVRIFDAIKFKATITPKVMTGRVLGDKTPHTRWGNQMDIALEMTRRRTTNWTKNVLRKYKDTGLTPEFTFVSVMNDKDSDYYAEHGEDTVTFVGCVPTSGFDLVNLDADGEYLEDALTCNCKDFIFSK